ncbi:MAG TPA: glycoside hydrolase family 127 protein [Planctomycetota bacterium]|nr:glycoside hydrolase family 127 protein [Planctomycetota bacterium]
MISPADVIVLSVALAGAVALAAEGSARREAVALRARPFDLKQVRLLEGPFRDAQERCRKYLHELDSDRLLHTWRLNAGLPSSAKPLGGWEAPNCELRGHSLGHYLSGCALMYASTGDEALKAKADALVAELAKCQKALGASGYLSAFPESFIDRVEDCKPVWAPYYTLHKVWAGLLDMHRHGGNAQALEVATRMAAWLKARLDKVDDARMERILNHTEQGGMNEALANLYAATGDPAHLALARRFDEKHYTEPLARGEDRLKGEHANSFIPNMIGSARQHELTGNPRDRQIAEFFWNQVVGARSYCTGGTSNNEHWQGDPHQLAHQLGDCTQETCCTYNMLKLTRHLFEWEPQAKYADYYERALLNSILATQDPATGMMMYFVPLAPGRWKTFNLPNDAFWCCTGTGFENHAKYGDSIYFHDEAGIWVNLFIASELHWPEKGIRLRQETRFPEQEGTTLIVRTEKPVTLALRIRVPYWAAKGVRVGVNGPPRPLSLEPAPPSYFVVERTWSDGDKLEVSLPMSLHAAPMPDDKTLVAFMCGPLVLAGKLGGGELIKDLTYTGQNWYRFPADKIAPAPPLLTESDDATTLLKPAEGQPLTFRTAGQAQDVTLIPYHKLFGERYAVYWRVYRKGSPEHRRALAEEEARRQQQARIVDEVKIGDAESEKAHRLQGERTASGTAFGRNWRHATDGGWFSYDLKVLPDAPLALACTWWGDEAGNRKFDILIEGTRLATVTLLHNKPGQFFEEEYPLPADLTRGKQAVTVRLQAHAGHIAGGIFGCAVLKAKPAE